MSERLYRLTMKARIFSFLAWPTLRLVVTKVTTLDDAYELASWLSDTGDHEIRVESWELDNAPSELIAQTRGA